MSDTTVFLEEYRPYTHEDAVADNIERIRNFHEAGDSYASTTQQVMIGLALCRPELLAAAGYPAPRMITMAWTILDDPQREAITRWWKS